MEDKLAIITVVYENYDVLDDFFKTLEDQTNKNFHLFISDLSDNKKEIKTYLPHTLIEADNKGYAHGVNKGLKKSSHMGFNYFAIVNNDIYFRNDFVEESMKALKENPGSIIGGKIYYAPGYEYHKKYKKDDLGKVLWYAGGYVDWDHALPFHRGVDHVDSGKYDKSEKTDYVAGTLMLFDNEVLEKVGYWDESYFLYFEDADFNERAKKQNINLFYNPEIVIYHKNAQSTGGAGSSLHVKYQRKNRLKFALKYAPFKTKLHVLKNYLLGRQ